MPKKYACTFFEDYEIETWLPTLGAVPSKLLASCDRSDDALDRGAAVQLENGKYALITESGCSCYESGDANIELFPTEDSVMAQYKIWLGDK